ncbi:MAG: radical SAM protein [Deltaproteobacteria bacterium]|nr:radical SAM protein [Deltaproteobacteria bacterium]
MHVLFVFLNNDSPLGFSHGLAVMSAELKEAGHQVSLLHVNEQLGLPPEQGRLSRAFRRRRPEVVALSFGTNHAAVAAQVAAWARDSLPDCHIVAGGVHPTLQPGEVLSWPAIDLVARGELDGYRFVAVVDDLERGRRPRRRPGVWLRQGRQVVRNPLGPPVDLGGASPPTDYGLFDQRRILKLKRGWADVLSGRGCPHRCSYCFNRSLRRCYRDDGGAGAAASRYVRKRPVDDVLVELARFRARYRDDLRMFSFVDDVFPIQRKWLRRFFDAYTGRFEVPLVFLARAGQVDDELARRARTAGTYMVRLGVESGSERVRRQVLLRREPNTAIRRAVKTLHQAGVNAFAYLMLGIPTESMAEVWSTFRLAARIGLDALRFSLCWPYPGTALHDRCRDTGLLKTGLEVFQGNYLTRSPLQWPRQRARFLQRIPRFYDVALNRFLDPRRAQAYGAMLETLRRCSDPEWTDGGLEQLRERADHLIAEALAAGDQAFVAPFADRPDILLRQGIDRSQPLILG